MHAIEFRSANASSFRTTTYDVLYLSSAIFVPARSIYALHQAALWLIATIKKMKYFRTYRSAEWDVKHLVLFDSILWTPLSCISRLVTSLALCNFPSRYRSCKGTRSWQTLGSKKKKQNVRTPDFNLRIACDTLARVTCITLSLVCLGKAWDLFFISGRNNDFKRHDERSFTSVLFLCARQ